MLVTQKQLRRLWNPVDMATVGGVFDLFRNRKALAGTYPGFDFVEPSGFTKADQLLGFSGRGGFDIGSVRGSRPRSRWRIFTYASR
jgi:hypothetical protein